MKILLTLRLRKAGLTVLCGIGQAHLELENSNTRL